jgi:N-formylglutamate amidohydrolase
MFVDQQRRWLRNTDWYLPEVYKFLPDLGMLMIEATHSRYVIDVNRDPCGPLFGHFSVALIAESNQGDSVYRQNPDAKSLSSRIAEYHAPYHAALSKNISEMTGRFGKVLLLDLHSYMGPGSADICIGNGNGTTCSDEVSAILHQAFTEVGFDTSINSPFAGGYIARTYGRPPRVHAVQIELRYPTYLDCTTIDQPGRPPLDHRRFSPTQIRLRRALQKAIDEFRGMS